MTGRPVLVFLCLLGLAAPAARPTRLRRLHPPPPPRLRPTPPGCRARGPVGAAGGRRRPHEADGIVARIDRSSALGFRHRRSAAEPRSGGDRRREHRGRTATARRADRAQPQWAEAWAARANADSLGGDPKATFVDLARALADDPKHLKAMADLGAVLENSGRRDDAFRVFQRALEIAPQWRPAREAADRLRAAIAGQDL